MPLHVSLKRGEGIRIGSDIVIVAVLDRNHPGRLALAISAPIEIPIKRFRNDNRQDGEVVDMKKV